MMDAHLKNVEKTCTSGKFDPYAGLATSGIAGTGPDKDKEEEEAKNERSGETESNKESPKKEGV